MGTAGTHLYTGQRLEGPEEAVEGGGHAVEGADVVSEQVDDALPGWRRTAAQQLLGHRQQLLVGRRQPAGVHYPDAPGVEQSVHCSQTVRDYQNIISPEHQKRTGADKAMYFRQSNYDNE